MKARAKSLAFAAGVAAILGMGWSSTAQACAVEPYLGSICIMAVSGSRFQTIGSTYTLAQGQTMAISQNQALYSLLGTTYGGNGVSTFNLPDLRGRVVVGYDARNPSFAVGAVGGSATVTLTVAQLPPHVMSINLPVALNGLSAATTLTGLSATANLAGVVISGPASGLTIRASSSSGGLSSPAGAYLGKPPAPQGYLYSNATPDATLNAGSITGNMSLTVAPGTTAPVSISGSASTAITGSASVTGASLPIGAGLPIPTMQPYLALPYYIALNGVYPSSN